MFPVFCIVSIYVHGDSEDKIEFCQSCLIVKYVIGRGHLLVVLNFMKQFLNNEA